MAEECFNENVCKYHSGIIEQIKSFNFFAKLAMVIFVLIGIGVVGFLWQGQTKLSDKVEANHIEMMKGIAALDKSVGQIEIRFHDLFKVNPKSMRFESNKESNKE